MENKNTENSKKTEAAAKLDLSFEQAASELDSIVAKLNSGSVQLDEMIALFERGSLLAEHCSSLLSEYDGRIAKAMRKPSNEASE